MYRVGDRFKETTKNFNPLFIEILEVERDAYLCKYVTEDGSPYGFSFRLPKTFFGTYFKHIPKKKKHIRHYFGETWDNK